MDNKTKLSKSTKKYILKKKACIRREILDIKKQKELIACLYSKSKNNKENNK